MSTYILEGPKLETPIPQKSVGQLVFDCLTENGDQICQIDGATGASETFSCVKTRSIRVAIELSKKGVNSKDVIVLWGENTLETIIPMFGAFFLGAKVIFPFSFGTIAIKQYLSSLHPRIVFVDEGKVTLVEEGLKELNLRSEIVVYDEHATRECLLDLTKPKSRIEEENFTPIEVDLDDVCIFFISSGTTGIPKMVQHTHRSYISMGYTLKEFGLGPSLLHLTPFSGISAHYAYLVPLLNGLPRIFLRSTNQETFFGTIEKFKVNTVLLNPFTSTILVDYKNFKKFDLTSLGTIYCGADKLNSKIRQKLSVMFPQAKIISWYGMTEVTKISAFGSKFHPEVCGKKTLSSGVPMYGTKVKIADLTTREPLGPNQIGEISVLSPCLFKAYFNDDNTNVFDEDGFFKTGDLGYYDEDKCIYVVDRIKWTFLYKSSTILPSKIEAVLLEHPTIKEAVVFGRPCGEDGDAPTACVVLDDDAQITEKEIVEFVAGKVADKEKLRGGVFVVGNLLRNIAGKYLKTEIKKAILENNQNKLQFFTHL